MRNARGLVLALIAFSATALPVPAHAVTPEAVQLRAKLSSRGFQCKSSPSGSVTCMSGHALVGYPQPFAVIVPPRYVPGGRLILHLHGWLENKPWDKTPQAILDYFDFPTLLARSQVLEDLFILPFSEGHCQTYKDELVDGFETILPRIYETLSEPWPATITFSGHSGAWTPMEKILEASFAGPRPKPFGGRIDSAFLFDATNSGDLPPFNQLPIELLSTEGFHKLSEAARDKPQPRIFTDYRDMTFTEIGAHRLARELGPSVQSVQLPMKFDHWKTVIREFPDFLKQLKE
jgi:hypothetical protein